MKLLLLAGNTYVFSWRITNGTCVSTSHATITDVLNTIANAGPERTRTVLSAFNLERNTPGTANTGTWRVVSAPFGHVYNFTDEIGGLPPGAVYYRLKQVDRDGNINFSEIIKVVINRNNSLSILSNPFDAQPRIRGYFTNQITNKNNPARLAGRPVKQLAEKSIVGMNNFTLDNLSAIAKGVYIIMIQTGSNIQAFKVVRNNKNPPSTDRGSHLPKSVRAIV